MTDAQFSRTAQQVLDLLRQNRGVPYAAHDVCEVVDCSSGEAQWALDVLADAGLIERQQSSGGTVTYIARS